MRRFGTCRGMRKWIVLEAPTFEFEAYSQWPEVLHAALRGEHVGNVWQHCRILGGDGQAVPLGPAGSTKR